MSSLTEREDTHFHGSQSEGDNQEHQLAVRTSRNVKNWADLKSWSSEDPQCSIYYEERGSLQQSFLGNVLCDRVLLKVEETTMK